MDKSEAERILTDWLWECRTCVFWTGDRNAANASGVCNSKSGPLAGKTTWTSGTCCKYDPFDVDTAFAVMGEAAMKNGTFPLIAQE